MQKEPDVKRILAVLAAWGALAGGAYGQPLQAEKVPVNVRDAFKSKFPDVSKVEWKLKTDKNYEAEFTLKDVEVAAKETETAIEQSALPEAVRATIAKEYKGYKVIETQKVERVGDKPILFEVHLENAEEVLKVQLEVNVAIVSKSAKRKKSP
jgi:hypothetical protein